MSAQVDIYREKFTIAYSKNKKYYYIKELACSKCSWVSVEKFDKPQHTQGWPNHSIQYDNTYYRHYCPFPFWKIKSGESEVVNNDHELVIDYVMCHDKR